MTSKGVHHQRERIAITGFFIVLLILITGCSSRGASYKAPLPSTVNPPIYPGAQNIRRDRPPNEVIIFETSDKPDEVLEYYKDIVLKEGWRFDQESQSENYLYVEYGPCPEYRFSVETRKESTGLTRVVLEVLTIICIE
ncbi:MAG TPA: hypothetical protein VJ183_18075 [Chloroflexia bacterium]|nr:hypothetical protein [Chloroflexia bacterium]